MTTCSHCGAPVDENQGFCSFCGQSLTATSQKPTGQSADMQAMNPYSNAAGLGVGAARAASEAYSGYRPEYSSSGNNNYSGNGNYSYNSANTENKAFVFGKERKEQRFRNFIDDSELLSENAYCAWLGGTVLYGLIINFIICLLVEKNIDTVIDFLGGPGYTATLIVYFILCIAGTMISNASTKPLISFIGYNMVVLPVGFILSISVFAYGGTSSAVVTNAVLVTLTITFIMTAISIAKPQIFAGLGSFLLTTLLILVVVSAISALLSKDYIIWSYIGAGIFSLYIGYDLYRAMQYPKTKDNAIDCALDIYLDIINLLLKILRIMASSKSKRK